MPAETGLVHWKMEIRLPGSVAASIYVRTTETAKEKFSSALSTWWVSEVTSVSVHESVSGLKVSDAGACGSFSDSVPGGSGG